MKRELLRFLMLALVTALTCATTSADQGHDEAEIRNVQTRQQESWNRHDARGYASLFTEDGDVVNVVGWWWKGRAEIESKLTDAYKFVFRDSTLTIDEVQVRFLTPQIAVAHVLWSMSGAKTPPGIPEPRKGIQTQLLQKKAGKWLIAAFQNTNAVPEVPFPTGPPVAQNDSVEEEIRKLDRAVSEAVLRSDVTILDELWADDFTVNAPNNQVVKGKKEVVALVRSGVIKYSSFVREIESVLRQGDTVIVMGLETVQPVGNAPGAGQTLRRRYSNIWMKKKGQWRLTARHANIICPR